MTEATTTSLDRIELLKPLTPEERAAVAQQCRFRRFKAGERITDQLGERCDVCFIVEGRVRVVNHSLSGREISFDDVQAGGFFGEISAIDGEPRSASVVALTDNTLVAFLPSGAFRKLVTSRPDLALAVMRRLSSIIRRSNERIMDLSTLAANNRVHAELLRLAKSGLRDDNTAVVSPFPIHADIASRVSTTRETVARVLSELTRCGIIERRANALVIRDVEALEDMIAEVRGLC